MRMTLEMALERRTEEMRARRITDEGMKEDRKEVEEMENGKREGVIARKKRSVRL